jgi:hypothetical protein
MTGESGVVPGSHQIQRLFMVSGFAVSTKTSPALVRIADTLPQKYVV